MRLQLIYRYDALTYQGEWCTGKILASSNNEAFINLTQQQKTPINIRLYKIVLFQDADKQYRIQLLEQLALLLHSGLALLPALTLLKNECHYSHWQCVLEDIIFNLMQGGSLSKQLTRYPLYFPTSLSRFIFIGEESGKLDEVINLQIIQLKKHQEIVKKIKKAFKYPFFLLTVLVFITSIMLFYVLPEYQSLYSTFNAELPHLTLALITFSTWLTDYISMITFIFIGLIFVYRLIRYSFPSFYFAEQALFLRIPYLGKFLKYQQLHLIFQIMSITQQAGLSLLQGLKIGTEQLIHPIYKQVLSQMSDHIMQGKSLSLFMKNEPLFTPICHQFIICAENSGQLLYFCQQLSDWFYHQLDEQLNTMSAWLEPILMAVIALIIGTLIIAMYLPILQLGDTIQ
ncbi:MULTISPECIES: type II secretion system F family protein [Enterobacterales]|uniref:type II secretion system F family protein n=1 Tax=Enterobacterales TaxID=91347 RepID=UPI000847F442|nr:MULTISPECIES: type II secretion system F family protein [Enterobacterales]ODQ06969.1 transporter [Shigella sp. FC130]OEI94365.1 transporter [Shigella sp. FC1655]WOO48862.1 type II secretion system F family protein [Hafnia alvei]WPF03329.1 type II secretion system F family protein [Proteus vulgaris]